MPMQPQFLQPISFQRCSWSSSLFVGESNQDNPSQALESGEIRRTPVLMEQLELLHSEFRAVAV